MHNHEAVHVEFERVARRRAGAPAARFSTGAITYRDLNACANRAARDLHDPALRDCPVAVLVPKGPAWLAAILGAMKAGRTVTFLDPDQPPERLAAHLDDLGPGATVVREADAARWRSDNDPGCPIIEPHPVAMIWYTSGSSGGPKGVMLPHAGILHNALKPGLEWLRPDDRILVATLHAGSLFGSLLSGGETFFATAAEDLAEAPAIISREGISVVFAAISAFRRLARAVTPGDTRRVRIVSMGSEPLDPHDLDLFDTAFPETAIPRLSYGSSEAFEISAVRERRPEARGARQHSGIPVPGKQVLLAPGGEILVRSRYLALGYWRNPGLTAERFVPDPECPDTVIYHTGDLGELLPGGELVVKGRKDSLAKIRGSFVSLVEVEAAVRALPGVKEAAACVFPGPAGNRLAAYVEPESSVVLSAPELRTSYRSRFPALEPPEVFHTIDDWPRTPSGKIDRQGLAEPEWGGPASAAGASDPPLNAVERLVRDTWREVLGFEEIGREADFLELGGNSLDAAAIASRLSRALFIAVSPGLVLGERTPARLAAALEQLPVDPEVAALLAEMETAETAR